jgi:hypothetical protein
VIRTAVLSLALLSSPSLAASYYAAEPTSPPAQQRFVARDNVWRCGEAGCTSTRTASRPAIVCASLVREVGALRSFSVEGRAFAAEELQSCNNRAR